MRNSGLRGRRKPGACPTNSISGRGHEIVTGAGMQALSGESVSVVEAKAKHIHYQPACAPALYSRAPVLWRINRGRMGVYYGQIRF